jgi:hypothetical protein
MTMTLQAYLARINTRYKAGKRFSTRYIEVKGLVPTLSGNIHNDHVRRKRSGTSPITELQSLLSKKR